MWPPPRHTVFKQRAPFAVEIPACTESQTLDITTNRFWSSWNFCLISLWLYIHFTTFSQAVNNVTAADTPVFCHTNALLLTGLLQQPTWLSTCRSAVLSRWQIHTMWNLNTLVYTVYDWCICVTDTFFGLFSVSSSAFFVAPTKLGPPSVTPAHTQSRSSFWAANCCSRWRSKSEMVCRPSITSAQRYRHEH